MTETTMRHLPLTVALSLVALPAQDAFQSRNFLPSDYHNVVQVDFHQLRETGVWDELETGVMKVLLGQLESGLGLQLSALDRLTMVPMRPEPTAEGDGDGARMSGPRTLTITIYEGNAELDVPDRILNDAGYAEEKIGQYTVRHRARWSDEVFFQPDPKVQIEGSTALLRPMLEGKANPGMPCADLMSLMSDRRDGLLFHAAIHLEDEEINNGAREMIFRDVEWPEGDAPQYMVIRCGAAGDPDDPNVELEVVLRHETESEGMAITERAVDNLFEKAMAEPQMLMLKPLLQGVARSRDGSDLSFQWDLGRGRAAAGRLTGLIMPLFLFGTTTREVGAPGAAAGLAEPLPVAEPPPPPKPVKAGEKGKEKK